ncbi:hypothetical protein JD969_08115 [Planctomycetota bacterium]|nr:hypothetical protein JD969_08115 [Planctomycetota bacterium]
MLGKHFLLTALLTATVLITGCSSYAQQDKWLRQDPTPQQEMQRLKSQETAAVSKEYKSMIETWLGFKLPRGTKPQYASQMGAYEQNLYIRFECDDVALKTVLDKMHLLDKQGKQPEQFVSDKYTQMNLMSYLDQGLFGAVPVFDKPVHSREVITNRSMTTAKAKIFLVRQSKDVNTVMIHISSYY